MATRHADLPAPSAVRERMAWKDICARYPDEWVVLIDVEHENGEEDNGEIVSAVVLGHSKKSGDCLRETKTIMDREQIRESAHLFTGPPVPPGFISFRLFGL